MDLTLYIYIHNLINDPDTIDCVEDVQNVQNITDLTSCTHI